MSRDNWIVSMLLNSHVVWFTGLLTSHKRWQFMSNVYIIVRCVKLATTRHNCFVECFRHSIKPTKSLSSVTLGKEVLTNFTSVIVSCRILFVSHSAKKKSSSPRQMMVTELLLSVLSAKASSLPIVSWASSEQPGHHWTPLTVSLKALNKDYFFAECRWSPVGLHVPCSCSKMKKLIHINLKAR